MSDIGFWIEPLQNRHGRSNFDCGHEWMNHYLHRFARQNTANGSSRTFVAVLPTETGVCGYFTLSAGAVALTDFPESTRQSWPRMETTVQAAALTGVAALELWDIDEVALNFYARFGFEPLLDDSLHLY